MSFAYSVAQAGLSLVAFGSSQLVHINSAAYVGVVS